MILMLLAQISEVPVRTISKDFYYLGGGAIAYLVLEKTFAFIKWLLSREKKEKEQEIQKSSGDGNSNGKSVAASIKGAFDERKEADKEWRDDIRRRLESVEGSLGDGNKEMGELNGKLDLVLSGLADVKKNCMERLAFCQMKRKE